MMRTSVSNLIELNKFKINLLIYYKRLILIILGFSDITLIPDRLFTVVSGTSNGQKNSDIGNIKKDYCIPFFYAKFFGTKKSIVIQSELQDFC